MTLCSSSVLYFSSGEPLEAQEPYDDSKTPQIPLVPLEEEDTQDGSDPSNLSSGPRVPSLGPSGRGMFGFALVCFAIL